MNEPIPPRQTPLIRFTRHVRLYYNGLLYYTFHAQDRKQALFVARRWARDELHSYKIVKTRCVQRRDWLVRVVFESDGLEDRVAYADHPRLAILWREWFEYPFLPAGVKPPKRRWK